MEFAVLLEPGEHDIQHRRIVGEDAESQDRDSDTSHELVGEGSITI